MFDIFSKRKQREQGNLVEAYQYDNLPEPLRFQIIYIWQEVIGHFPEVTFRGADVFFSGVERALCEEYGLPHLTGRSRQSEEEVCNFFLQQREVEKCLDIIEIVFAFFVRFVQSDRYIHSGQMDHIRLATEKVNARFKEHAIGYELHDGQIIRMDSAFLHKNAVAPAMTLLRERYLAGANQEFLKAHEHFRHGRFGECINECLKAFESTMKAICHERGWSYNQTDTAKTLLATCEKNGLFPTFMQSSLSALRSVLENVATIRNKLSGHGQGAQPVQITEEVAAFVLHSTGANILLLASLEKK